MTSEFNFLVLGQTGTGKSTWINSIANYLTYASMEEALDAKHPICLIPSKFTLIDDNYRQIAVSLGEADKNEDAGAGKSCTKTPRVYSFYRGGQKINFMDVPGIGDTEGIEKDKENTTLILDTVALFKELHGICIVLKATETRMTTEFKYCLSELLTHLHRNALENVIFVFTNTRGADYKPGSAYTPLLAYLDELRKTRNIDVPLSRHVSFL